MGLLAHDVVSENRHSKLGKKYSARLHFPKPRLFLFSTPSTVVQAFAAGSASLAFCCPLEG